VHFFLLRLIIDSCHFFYLYSAFYSCCCNLLSIPIVNSNMMCHCIALNDYVSMSSVWEPIYATDFHCNKKTVIHCI
jgi:hypothetical protein